MGIEYVGAGDAFLGELTRVIRTGHSVTRRTDPTRELTGESFTIVESSRRCIVVPHRNNNVSASIAESLWTLAGRADIAFLEPYLPRARSFSDDGATWRAAYGPRLRGAFGVDQLDEVRRLLLHDSYTRRAVISLFDPASDYADVNTRDVPCNNWLHFLRVGDCLDVSIAVRSLDLIWGFSGIDAFLWSLVHELMASWVGLEVGRQHWFVGSCHVYQTHFGRAEQMLAPVPQPDAPSRNVKYAGNWSSLEQDLSAWFGVETALRSGRELSCQEVERLIPEPLLCALAVTVAAFWDLQYERSITERLVWLSGTEFSAAVTQLASWLTPRLRG